MKQFEVILKKKAIETDIKIMSIPLRLGFIVKNGFSIISHQVRETLYSVIHPDRENKSGLASAIQSVLRVIYISINPEWSIKSTSPGVTFAKYVGKCSDYFSISSSDLHASTMRYRTLSDLDSNAPEGLLSSYDDMSLEDIDYIII